MGKVTDVIKNLTCVILDMPKFKQVFFFGLNLLQKNQQYSRKDKNIKRKYFSFGRRKKSNVDLLRLVTPKAHS